MVEAGTVRAGGAQPKSQMEVLMVEATRCGESRSSTATKPNGAVDGGVVLERAVLPKPNGALDDAMVEARAARAGAAQPKPNGAVNGAMVEAGRT